MSGIGGRATADVHRVAEEESLLRLAGALGHRGSNATEIHRGPGIGLAVLTIQMWDDLFVSGRRPWSDAVDQHSTVN